MCSLCIYILVVYQFVIVDARTMYHLTTVVKQCRPQDTCKQKPHTCNVFKQVCHKNYSPCIRTQWGIIYTM